MAVEVIGSHWMLEVNWYLGLSRFSSFKFQGKACNFGSLNHLTAQNDFSQLNIGPEMLVYDRNFT